MIIHICGAPGSNHSSLFTRLAKFYKNRIIIKQMSALMLEFLHEHESRDISLGDFIRKFADLYQEYIRQFIDLHKTRDIVFIGLNAVRDAYDVDFRGRKITCPVACYNLHSTHKLYIQLPENIVMRRWYDKQFGPYVDAYYKQLLANKDKIYNQLVASNNAATNMLIDPLLTGPFDFSTIRDTIASWAAFYKCRGYVPIAYDKVYCTVRHMLAHINTVPELHRMDRAASPTKLARTESPSRYHISACPRVAFLAPHTTRIASPSRAHR